MTLNPDVAKSRQYAPITAVMATKISIPPQLESNIDRLRLMDKLDQGSRLTIVTAPAGFGKTTLVSRWLQSRSITTAWLSLEPGDGGFVRFWSHVAAAIDSCSSGFSSQLEPLLSHPPASEESGIFFILQRIGQLPASITLVLDDYQYIAETSAGSSLASFIRHMPANCSLILISRTLPALPLARMRLQQQIVHIDADDLRFSIEEVEDLQERSRRRRLSRQELELLEQKTEGWAAGLILALLSMEGNGDGLAFLVSFSGGNRFIIDYLVDEVLNRLDEELLSFMLQTSILSRISAPLAQAVTGRRDSAELLHHLERSHLFFIPLDDTRTWYRYHHLFGEMLQARLVLKLDRADIRALHGKASRWHATEGDALAAIHHAFEAGDCEAAAACMELNFSLLLSSGEEAALLSWLNKLPLEQKVLRPDLFYFQIGRLALAGHVQAAQNLLDQTQKLLAVNEGLLSQDQLRELELRLGLYRASVAFYQGDVDAFIHLLDLHSEGLERFESIVKVVNLSEAILCRGPIGFGGKLRKMAYLAGQVALTESRQQAVQHALQGYGFVFLADFHYEWNRLEEAQAILSMALAFPMSERNLGVLTPAIILQSKIYQARNDLEKAASILEKAISDLEEQRSPHWQLLLEARLAQLQLAQGNEAAASSWAERRHIDMPEKAVVTHEYVHLTLARLLFSRQQRDQSIPLLHLLREEAARAGRIGSQIEINLLLALSYQEQDMQVSAVECLRTALRLAEPEGYIRIFLDEGEALREIMLGSLRFLRVQEPNLHAYTKQLLETQWSSGRGPSPGITEIDEKQRSISLTQRELEVLHLIVQGNSNEGIADLLFLSQGTIKRYTHNLYKKLGVQNRVQAVVRASELHLV